MKCFVEEKKCWIRCYKNALQNFYGVFIKLKTFDFIGATHANSKATIPPTKERESIDKSL